MKNDKEKRKREKRKRYKASIVYLRMLMTEFIFENCFFGRRGKAV